jgi:DNA-binding NarL/FixJ family response regulator
MQYNILIIDDNPGFVKSLKDLLIDVAGQLISQIQYAFNAADGLILIRDNTFHYVFMDLNMPDIDGISATRFARYEYKKPEMKIIGISAYCEDYFVHQMLKAGANYYIPKDDIDAEKIIAIFTTDCTIS